MDMGKRRQSKSSKPDYEVGYGKPPAATRFKAGQSGNPKGRKKGARTLVALVDEALNKKITVREGEKYTTVTKKQAFAHQLANQIVKLDPKAIAALMAMFRGTAELVPDFVNPAVSSDQIRAEDQAILRRFFGSEDDR